MAIPASVIPSGNSYSVHVAGPASAGAQGTALTDPASNLLTVAAAACAALLKTHKVDVRQHLTGDDAVTQATRDFLARAGGKASAFSPAPAPGVAGEGFWKTTLALVQATPRDAGSENEARDPGAGAANPAASDDPADSPDFWWPPRADKKVEWDCLLVALCDGRDGFPEIPARQMFLPDLWVVATTENPSVVMEAWIGLGAGAVAVISPEGTAWASRNASCGNALGFKPFATPLALDDFTVGCFAGAAAAALIEELLADNLFDKSWVRVDRADLETRPLHAGRAALFAAHAVHAAHAARAAGTGERTGGSAAERLLHKSGDLLGRIRALQAAENPGGPAKPWGSKGR